MIRQVTERLERTADVGKGFPLHWREGVARGAGKAAEGGYRTWLMSQGVTGMITGWVTAREQLCNDGAETTVLGGRYDQAPGGCARRGVGSGCRSRTRY